MSDLLIFKFLSSLVDRVWEFYTPYRPIVFNCKYMDEPFSLLLFFFMKMNKINDEFSNLALT